MAGGHAQPRHPVVLRSLTEPLSRANSRFYGADGARWYAAEYSWRTEDIPFYQRVADESAGAGGAVLELACGEGRITVPMAQAGFRVTGLDSSGEMLRRLRERVDAYQDPPLRDRVETIEGDMRRFHLDRLFRMVYLPFNTLLILDEPEDRYRALDCVREHLAPSGVFAFDIFTPDPRLLVDESEYRVELDHNADVPDVGRVHVLREVKSAMDYRRQVKHVGMRHTITQKGATLAHWEDSLDIAMIFPSELDLLLERQGFRIRHRYGGPDLQPYAPTSEYMQPQYVVAELEP